MESLYFAYGSNLAPARMGARVPSARPRGGACLRGHRLTLDKRSLDGSAKANIHPTPGDWVFGALYRISAVHWADLDACERGYRRISVEVDTASGRFRAWTYRSRDLTPRTVAYEWYKELMLGGAAAHGLPAAWQQRLAALPSRPDPRPRFRS